MGTLPANSLQQLAPNSVLTVGLAGVALVSLLWLLRPFPALDRVILFAVFGIAIACALLQFFYGDGDVPKHLYLLVALITAIQGVLLATQMERVRKGMRR
jgi:CHASE2 domain-containing sensor protein